MQEDEQHAAWRTVEAVEVASAEYVDWLNHRHLYENCDDMPPAQREELYYAQHGAQPSAELSPR